MIARRALKRRAEGGKRAVGRASLSTADYAEMRQRIFERAGYRCECCRMAPATEIEHALPAARGGADDADTNCWATCRTCHRWKEAPFANSRLVVVALGGGRFRWEEWKGPDKWTAHLVRVVRDGSL